MRLGLPSRGQGVRRGRQTSYRLLEGELLPLEPALFADAADGQWHEHSLLTAALVASGVVDPQAIDGYTRRWTNWSTSCSSRAK